MSVKSKLMNWRKREKQTESASPKSTPNSPALPQLFQGCATTSEIEAELIGETISSIRTVLAGMREDTRIIKRKLGIQL